MKELADWGWLIRDTASRRRHRGTPYAELPVVTLPCQIVLTFRHGGNGVLNVRCRCQAQTRDVPAERYYGYDILGTARTLREAVSLWEDHLPGGEA